MDGEDGVDAGVGVLDLHVEVGQRGAVGNVFRDGDLVLGLVEPGRLVIDIPDGDGQVGCRAGAGLQTWELRRNYISILLIILSALRD